MHIPDGFSNKTLRPIVAQLLGRDPNQYTSSQMSYDLSRLKKKGIIFKKPHSHKYTITPYGQRVAVCFTKLNERIFYPIFISINNVSIIETPLTYIFKKLEKMIYNIISSAKIGY
jgi:hypothetical protein